MSIPESVQSFQVLQVDEVQKSTLPSLLIILLSVATIAVRTPWLGWRRFWRTRVWPLAAGCSWRYRRQLWGLVVTFTTTHNLQSKQENYTEKCHPHRVCAPQRVQSWRPWQERLSYKTVCLAHRQATCHTWVSGSEGCTISSWSLSTNPLRESSSSNGGGEGALIFRWK